MSRFTSRARRSMQLSLSGIAGSFEVPASAQGFSLELSRCPPAGARLTGSLSLDGEAFDFDGEVSWSQPLDPRASVLGRMTVRFTRIGDHFFDRLRCQSRTGA